MADMDEPSLLDNDYDFDNQGKFIRKEDGFGYQKADIDYHDHLGRENKTPIPRIIGRTNPKVEHFTEGHPSNKLKLTVM